MFKVALLSAAMLAAATPAGAAVIDFDSLTKASGYSYVYGPYQEDGYTLSSSSCSSAGTCFTSVQAFKDIDPAGASVVNFHGSAVLTLAADDGAAFTLESIDLSEYWDDLTYGSGTMSALFSFAFADGTSSSETFTFDTRGRYPVTTLDFALAPLTSFSFKPTTGTSGFLQFDNIAVSAVSGAVPEPATWAMMIGGFGLVGGAARRSRRMSAVTA